MARKIKETPVLTGENARYFDRMLETNKNKKVSKEDYQRAQKNYEVIMNNSNIV